MDALSGPSAKKAPVWRRKAVMTLAVGVIIALGALAGDYTFNVLLFPNPAGYTPFISMTIGLCVGTPISYFLISQRIDIEKVKEQLAESVAYQQRAVVEIRLRSQEAERAQAEAERALERLRDSEGLYRLLADNSTDVIALWSRDGRRRYTSPSAERAFGYAAADLMAMDDNANIHPEDVETVMAAIRAMEPGSPSHTLECRVLRKDGGEDWVEATFKRLADEPESLLSTTRVITARKRLQTELVRALDEAKTALAVKTDFLANMTHELRTPLNAIVGFSGLLRRSSALEPEDARKVALISDASQTLLRVVNDVLDFSKLEAGAIELEQQPFDPFELAQSSLDLLAEQGAAKGLALRVEVDGLGGALLGDGPRLRQVVLNFASNAIKFTAKGEVAVKVVQRPEHSGRRLRIEVRDTGIGVPSDQLSHIFERFTQADASVSRRFGGTGLGLAICRRIVEAHGGEIGVDSVLGSGSTFWFEISLPGAADVAHQAPAETEQAALERPLKLLVVDDNAVNRELICGLLAPFEIELETAEDGVAAVEAATRSGFDLILMDVQMPNMDGLTATRRIRADFGDQTPIIAMTANVLPEQVARCLEAGMNDHLGKPINPHELLAALARWSAGRDEPAPVQQQG